jgi:predicted PurR-regulated permease PerM
MTTSEDEGRSGWRRFVLIALGALAGLVAAAIAWGRAAPRPEPVEEADTDAARAEREVVTVAATASALPPGWDVKRAPAWVRPTVLWTIGIVVAIAAAFAILGILHRLVIWLLLALFFSFALEPAVNYLHDRRGWKRGTATGLLLGLTLLLLLVVGGVFLAALIQGAIKIVESLPQWADQASDWLSDTFGIEVSTEAVSSTSTQSAASLADALDDPLSALLGFSLSLVGGIFEMFTVGMFIFYMVAEGPKFKRAVLSFFPHERQEELVSIWEAAIDKTGGYFYSKLLLTLINGGLFWIVLLILGVPGAAALALFQGVVAEFIPIIGTYIAAIVPLVIALFSVGMPETLILLVYVLIYQQVENYLLAPRLQSKVMELHPAVAFGAALAGGMIGGLLWAFLALPFAATIQASASLWLERHEVLESEFTAEEHTVVVVKQEKPERSFGNRIGGWLRSSRGWLRRTDEPQDAAEAAEETARAASDVASQITGEAPPPAPGP